MNESLSHIALFYSYSLAMRYEKQHDVVRFKQSLITCVVASGMKYDPEVTLKGYLTYRESDVGKSLLNRFS